MPYTLGTVAATKLKTELAAHIETLRASFPARHVNVVIGDGNTRKGGTRIEIYTQADEQAAHLYRAGGKLISEEWHRIAIDVKADAKAGGPEVAEAVYGVLKNAFTAAVQTGALMPRGIYELRVSAEAPDYGEIQFERPLHLTCNTDTYLE